MNVVRVYMGSLMTSLEMAGVSLTLLHMVPRLGWEELLGILCGHYGDAIHRNTTIAIQTHPPLPAVGPTCSLPAKLLQVLSPQFYQPATAMR